MSKPREESLSKRVVFQPEEWSVFSYLLTYFKWTNLPPLQENCLSTISAIFIAIVKSSKNYIFTKELPKSVTYVDKHLDLSVNNCIVL